MADAGLAPDVRRLRRSIEDDRRSNAAQWRRVDTAFAAIVRREELQAERCETRGLRLTVAALSLEVAGFVCGVVLALSDPVDRAVSHAVPVAILAGTAMLLGAMLLVRVVTVFRRLRRSSRQAMSFAMHLSSGAVERDAHETALPSAHH